MRKDRDHIAALAWMALAVLGVALAGWYMAREFDLLHPGLLWLLALPALLALVHLLRMRKRHAQVPLPTLRVLAKGPMDLLAPFRQLPMALGLGGLALLLLALARPQSRDSWENVEREGIDIVIAMDVSVSMLAKDLKPDRLEASKQVALDFIDQRPNDRIGLVLYEAEAFTQCPLTTDHHVLKELFSAARPGLLQGGTAIGMGLATALNRLRESEARSRVVILLTDGMNNAGVVQPLDAAQIAETLGIRVYTIGLGTRGKALSPVDRYPNGKYRFEYVDVDLDEPLMERIAAMTGGQYFRATDEKKLGEIYGEIDRLEKTRIKVTEYSQRNEEYFPFAQAGLALLLIGFALDRTLLRYMA
jgi:Ca-activated chloride channel family protein